MPQRTDPRYQPPGRSGSRQGNTCVRRTFLVFLSLLPGFMVLFGCKPVETVETVETVDAPESTRPAMLALEVKADRFYNFTPEPDPQKRPLVLSQPASTRRDWALQSLLRGYRESGKTNAQWDAEMEAAFEAYCEYTRVSLDNWPELRQALDATLATGCDDPMLAYMRVRYRVEGTLKQVTAADYLQASLEMAKGGYHPLFKFMAGLRAAQAVRDADSKLRVPGLLTWTTLQAEDVARDTNAPVNEVFQIASLWLAHSHSKEWIAFITSDLEPILLTNWGQTERWHRFHGRLETRRAWGERGGGYADTVTGDGWQGFGDHLALAEDALTTAWGMNTNIEETAYLMMRVELGQGQGLDRMETWFNRAMAINTNFYAAASLMSFYLEPRWYGSDAQALAFARSCVSSEEWGGRVPLILADLHRSLARYYELTESPEYWHQSHVQQDVQTSYERFFQLNPEYVRWRHNYAKDAFQCGLYQVFLDQLPLFTAWTNHAFFGEGERFQEMIAEATEAVAVGAEE